MMRSLFLLSADTSSQGGGMSPALMTIIAMLLLFLPYLIRRYTGRSITEILSIRALLGWIERLADKVRAKVYALFGKEPPMAKLLASSGQKEKSGKASADGDGSDGGASLKEEIKREKEQRRRAGNAQGDYLRAVSQILTYVRRNRLFAIIPGNIEHNDKTAGLVALVVTGSKVVGVMAHGYEGTVICAEGNKAWSVVEDGNKRQTGSLGLDAARQDQLLRSAMDAHGMGDIPSTTVMLFTGGTASLKGDVPKNAFILKDFFAFLDSNKEGPLDPKDIGKKLSLLRAGNKGKKRKS